LKTGYNDFVHKPDEFLKPKKLKNLRELVKVFQSSVGIETNDSHQNM